MDFIKTWREDGERAKEKLLNLLVQIWRKGWMQEFLLNLINFILVSDRSMYYEPFYIYLHCDG